MYVKELRTIQALHGIGSWAVPPGAGVIRNVSVTADGKLAIAESGVNRIGLVTIK